VAEYGPFFQGTGRGFIDFVYQAHAGMCEPLPSSQQHHHRVRTAGAGDQRSLRDRGIANPSGRAADADHDTRP
jgi:hypothetical protein